MNTQKTQKFFQYFFAILFVLIGFLFFTKQSKTVPVTVEDRLSNFSTSTSDLIGFSIVPGSHVYGIISYRGTISGGYFFESNIKVEILDVNKKVLKASNAVATNDWMTDGPVDFEGNIDFTGLASTSGYFRLVNDNPSGDLSKDKFVDVPIIIN
jgi:hypothetical protein